MADPQRLHGFLQKTIAALKRATDDGDMEKMDLYSSYLERSKPLVEEIQANPPPAPVQPQADPSVDAAKTRMEGQAMVPQDRKMGRRPIAGPTYPEGQFPERGMEFGPQGSVLPQGQASKDYFQLRTQQQNTAPQGPPAPSETMMPPGLDMIGPSGPVAPQIPSANPQIRPQNRAPVPGKAPMLQKLDKYSGANYMVGDEPKDPNKVDLMFPYVRPKAGTSLDPAPAPPMGTQNEMMGIPPSMAPFPAIAEQPPQLIGPAPRTAPAELPMPAPASNDFLNLGAWGGFSRPGSTDNMNSALPMPKAEGALATPKAKDWAAKEFPAGDIPSGNNPASQAGDMAGNMAQLAFENPATMEEAQALRRIEKELGDKPSALSLENLVVMLLMGAPATLKKILTENSEYQAGVRSIYNNLRAEKRQSARDTKNDEYRGRSLKAQELNAASSAAMKEDTVSRRDAEYRAKNARTIVNSATNPNSEEYKKALKYLDSIGEGPQAKK